MEEIRKNQRYYIKDKSQFLIQVETNNGRLVDCILHDISISGACVIIDREVFIQREKPYPFQIFKKQTGGEMVKITSVIGKLVWYLSKEYLDKEMLYLGIVFQDKIDLPDSITLEEEAFV